MRSAIGRADFQPSRLQDDGEGEAFVHQREKPRCAQAAISIRQAPRRSLGLFHHTARHIPVSVTADKISIGETGFGVPPKRARQKLRYCFALPLSAVAAHCEPSPDRPHKSTVVQCRLAGFP